MENACKLLIEDNIANENQLKKMNNLYEQKKMEHNKLQASNKTDNNMYIELVHQLNSLENDVQRYDQEIGTHKGDYDDLVKRELRLMSTIEKKKIQVTDYKNQINENEARIKKLEIELDDVNETITNLQNELEDLMSEVEAYKRDVGEHDKKRAELEKKRDNMRRDLSKTIENNARLTVDIQKISKEIELLEESHNEALEESNEKSEALEELRNKQSNQNTNLAQVTKNLKKMKGNISCLNNAMNEYKSVSTDIINLYDQFDKVVWKIKQLKDNPEELDATKKLVANLKEDLSGINSQMLVIKQENVMLEQEAKILKELKTKLGKELDHLKSQKKKNEVLNNYLLQDNVRNKDEYLELIYEEMNTLRNIRLECDNLDNQTKEKALDIINTIKQEQDYKKTLVAQQMAEQDDKLPVSYSDSQNSNENLKKTSVNNSLFLPDDSVPSDNLVDPQPDLYEQKPLEVVHPKRKSNLGLRNSSSLRTYEFTRNLYNNPDIASSRNASIDHLSFNHLYKQENYQESSELQINWKSIIKDLMRLISFFMKSSSTMANNISAIIGKAVKSSNSFQKLRSAIVK